MILNPLEEFVIARQLNDPNDVGTYYVRAFVRNAKTDALLNTINLDDKGSQRFTKTWQVPQDPTGSGLYITITTFVYTDSGYSTLSTTYGSEQHEFLVQDRINPYLRQVSPDIDYKRIRKIIEEVMAGIPQSKPEEFDYETLANGFEAVINRVEAIRIPEYDLSPILSRLEALKAQISAIPTDKSPETDLQPVIDRTDIIASLVDDLSGSIFDNQTKTEGYLGKLDTAVLKDQLNELVNKLDDIEDLIELTGKEAILKEQQRIKEKRSKEVLREYLNEY